MNEYQRQLLNLKLRHDLVTFIHRTFQTIAPAQTYLHNWHIQAIAWHLQQCLTGDITRLIITLPPRYLKSICASVAFPAWALGQDPSRHIVCASYAEKLAIKHALDCRTVMESLWYQQAFPGTRISRDKNTELHFLTTKLGGRYTTSVGGTLTGRGGNLIIVDDPIKAEDAMSQTQRARVNDWFDRTVYSRLDDKRRDGIIVIMQRLHVEDLVGHLLQHDEWVHLNLPAIAELDQIVPIGPEATYLRPRGSLLHAAREPQSVLDRLQRDLGSMNFSAQYQQQPVPPEGNVVKWKWFQVYDQPPSRASGDLIVQSWDTASKDTELADYSVCTTWLVQGQDYYLLDVYRERLDYPALKQAVIRQARTFRATRVLIEDAGSGMALIQELRQQSLHEVPRPIKVKPQGDKVMRLSTQSAAIEAGQVFLPRQAAWLEDFQKELLAFPYGSFDDQVDSLSQFLIWIKDHRYPRVRMVKLLGF